MGNSPARPLCRPLGAELACVKFVSKPEILPAEETDAGHMRLQQMTMLDVVFRYGMPPGEKQMLALNNAWEVYGVRKIKFDEKEHTVRVEYDATRLNDGEIAAILRRAGVDLREKVQLV
jgi:hypothetical protein